MTRRIFPGLSALLLLILQVDHNQNALLSNKGISGHFHCKELQLHHFSSSQYANIEMALSLAFSTALFFSGSLNVPLFIQIVLSMFWFPCQFQKVLVSCLVLSTEGPFLFKLNLFSVAVQVGR